MAESPKALNKISKKRIISASVLGVIVVAIVVAFLTIPSLNQWARDTAAMLNTNPQEVAAYIRSFGAWGPIISTLLMVFQSVAAPIPAFLITFANGMIWGWFWGAALSWSSAMLAASICFFIARILGRPAVEKLVGGSKPLEMADQFFERFGTRTILVTRLLPFVSFDIVSYAAGLTNMGFWRFFIATGIGQLPATIFYSWLASIGGASQSIKVLFTVFSTVTGLSILFFVLQPILTKRVLKKKSTDAEKDLANEPSN